MAFVLALFLLLGDTSQAFAYDGSLSTDEVPFYVEETETSDVSLNDVSESEIIDFGEADSFDDGEELTLVNVSLPESVTLEDYIEIISSNQLGLSSSMQLVYTFSDDSQVIGNPFDATWIKYGLSYSILNCDNNKVYKYNENKPAGNYAYSIGCGYYDPETGTPDFTLGPWNLTFKIFPISNAISMATDGTVYNFAPNITSVFDGQGNWVENKTIGDPVDYKIDLEEGKTYSFSITQQDCMALYDSNGVRLGGNTGGTSLNNYRCEKTGTYYLDITSFSHGSVSVKIVPEIISIDVSDNRYQTEFLYQLDEISKYSFAGLGFVVRYADETSKEYLADYEYYDGDEFNFFTYEILNSEKNPVEGDTSYLPIGEYWVKISISSFSFYFSFSVVAPDDVPEITIDEPYPVYTDMIEHINGDLSPRDCWIHLTANKGDLISLKASAYCAFRRSVIDGQRYYINNDGSYSFMYDGDKDTADVYVQIAPYDDGTLTMSIEKKVKSLTLLDGDYPCKEYYHGINNILEGTYAKLKIEYSDGSSETIVDVANPMSTLSKYGIKIAVYDESKTRVINSEYMGYDVYSTYPVGKYKLVYYMSYDKDICACCDIEVKDKDDAPEITLNGPAVLAYYTAEKLAGGTGYAFPKKKQSSYKFTLPVGTYVFDSNYAANFLIVDENGNTLVSAYNRKRLFFENKAEGTYYIDITNQNTTVKKDAKITLKSAPAPKSISVVTKPSKTSFMFGFDAIDLSGSSFKIVYDDKSNGDVVKVYTDEFNDTFECDILTTKYKPAYQYADEYGNLPIGSYYVRVSIPGSEIHADIPIKVTDVKVYGEIKVGAGLNVKCNMTKNPAGYYPEYTREGSTPSIVSVNLIEGETYLFSRGSTSWDNGMMSLYDPDCQLISDSNYYGFKYKAQDTGKYYIKIYTPGCTLNVNKVYEISEVEVLSPQYQKMITPGVNPFTYLQFYGIELLVTYENGEQEAIAYGDTAWDEYGITSWSVSDAAGNTYHTYDDFSEQGVDYYIDMTIPGYEGEIVNKELLKFRAASLDEARIPFGEKFTIPVNDDGCVSTTDYYFFDVEQGRTYMFLCNKAGVDAYIIRGSNQDFVSDRYAPGEASTYFAEEDGRIYVGMYYYGYEDMSDSYLLVDEIDRPISVAFSGELAESSFRYGLDEINPAGISIEISGAEYDGDAYITKEESVLPSQFSDKAILCKVCDSDGNLYECNDWDNLGIGKYTFSYLIPGYGWTNDKSHSFEIVKGAKSYSVVFNSNYPAGTDKKVTQTIANNKSVALKANSFSCSGYSFLGWSETPDGEVAYEDKETVYNLSDGDKDINLYAQWDIAEYKITWHLEGGEWADWYKETEAYANKDSYRIDSETFVIPDVSAVEAGENFEFDGWYIADNYRGEAENIEKGSVGDRDFYAKWIPAEYTIQFDGNGNDKGGTMKNQKVKYGVDAKLSTNAFRDSRAFIGWTPDREGLSVILANSSEINISSEELKPFINNKVLTLYAVWVESFTIEYFVNEGVMPEDAPIAYEYGNKFTLPKPTREGYTFGGWYKDNEEYKSKVEKITATTAGNLKLYAKWNPITYTLQFNVNGGTGKMANQTMTYDVMANLRNNSLTKKGYEFKGWTDNSLAASVKKMTPAEYQTFIDDPQHKVYENGAMVENLANTKVTIKLAAVWVEAKYKVDFVTYCGSSVDSIEYSYGDEIALPTNLTKPHYDFGGWFKDEKFKTQVKTTKGLSGDVVLYAKWTAKYEVIFNDNGQTGTKTMNPQAMVFGTSKALLANTYTKTGNVFMGWALSLEDANAGVVAFTNKQSITGRECEEKITFENDSLKLTLYAVWRDTFSIEYNLNTPEKGTEAHISSKCLKSYKYGETWTLPAPVRTGYTFGGWYTDAKCKKKFSSITATTSGDLVLYAKWTGLKYTVEFNSNAPTGTKVSGKLSKQSLVYGTTKAISKNKFKISGYTFEGWATSKAKADAGIVSYTNGAKLADYTDPVIGANNVGDYKSSVVLYAVWHKDEYKVTYIMNGVVDDVVIENAYSVDTGYKLMEAPSRIGYTFQGFYTDKNCKKKAKDYAKGSTGNITLYAKWKAQ